MNRNELRKFWINTDNILCQMLDGEVAILIKGPSEDAVQRGDWQFGFQVHGEEDIRWRMAEQIERIGNSNALMEIEATK